MNSLYTASDLNNLDDDMRTRLASLIVEEVRTRIAIIDRTVALIDRAIETGTGNELYSRMVHPAYGFNLPAAPASADPLSAYRASLIESSVKMHTEILFEATTDWDGFVQSIKTANHFLKDVQALMYSWRDNAMKSEALTRFEHAWGVPCDQ